MTRTEHPLPDGRTAARFELRSAAGIRVVVTNLGATLMRVDQPDRDGRPANILLGHDDPALYPAAGAPGPDSYMGATCGRYANRIRGAAFMLDGRVVRLAANEGANQLHGGPSGFSRAVWQVEEVRSGRLLLAHRSPDGDGGFPGTLLARARFALSDAGLLSIDYRARCDAPTAVNLVSHPYFNLSGDPAATNLDHRLRIAAESFLPIDAEALPTGERRAVAGTPFDFRDVRPVGERIEERDAQLALGDGYNHCFVPVGDGLREVAVLEHPPSGRRMSVETDQPGLQLYSGNALPVRRSGLCLETQGWPDAVNHPDFPNPWLRPGEVYRSRTRLRFSTA